MKLVIGGRALEVVFRRATAEDCPKIAEKERAATYRRGYDSGFGVGVAEIAVLRAANVTEVMWRSPKRHLKPYDAFSEGFRDGKVVAHGQKGDDQ